MLIKTITRFEGKKQEKIELSMMKIWNLIYNFNLIESCHQIFMLNIQHGINFIFTSYKFYVFEHKNIFTEMKET